MSRFWWLVQITINGISETVCPANWTARDVPLVCRLDRSCSLPRKSLGDLSCQNGLLLNSHASSAAFFNISCVRGRAVATHGQARLCGVSIPPSISFKHPMYLPNPPAKKPPIPNPNSNANSLFRGYHKSLNLERKPYSSLANVAALLIVSLVMRNPSFAKAIVSPLGAVTVWYAKSPCT
jgi:hypothetical protein